ncbi:hypothetical protein [Bradyrhizobium sp. BWA-3-5]|uniref:hypothetical protein n=1 Tax=Bradyrhizobium sp. BWA-3-5 TaxID=3080013 RepID=UPI00293F4111|nr:hypothetical protein [Bradyrhizobium sp. BWA-3-5]WOH64040.1 hypothetical protein RX331_25930 [Bradyrhizobium sp. BWA-3-5]
MQETFLVAFLSTVKGYIAEGTRLFIINPPDKLSAFTPALMRELDDARHRIEGYLRKAEPRRLRGDDDVARRADDRSGRRIRLIGDCRILEIQNGYQASRHVRQPPVGRDTMPPRPQAERISWLRKGHHSDTEA